MKPCIYSFFVLIFLGGGLVSAQERRTPTEIYVFEVEASTPSDITASVDPTGKVAVWSNYSEKTDDRGRVLSFGAKKFQIYERGKSRKTALDSKDIPRYESVGVKRVSFSDGIEWSPSGGIERDNKIVFKGMSKIGFQNDAFVLGPFDYTIRWSRPLGFTKLGFLYVIAECSKRKVTPIRADSDLFIFQMVYKLNKKGQLVDSFVFETAQYAPSSGMGARYPWKWRTETVHIDENGDFYAIGKSSSTQEGKSKIMVERWASK